MIGSIAAGVAVVWAVGVWVGMQALMMDACPDLPVRAIAARLVFWPITLTVFLWRGCKEVWRP